MQKHTVQEDVSAKIDALLAQREQEKQTIENSIETATAQKCKAENAAKEAIEKTDFSAYEAAKEAIRKASAAIEMFTARLEQLNCKKFVHEDESDRVIDSLLAYEDDLANKYASETDAIIENLKLINDAYRAEVQKVESTITRWTAHIHPNYRSSTTIYAETGTNRSTTPVPVHSLPYFGSDRSHRISKFLQDELRLN